MKVLIDDGLSTLHRPGGIGDNSYYLWKHLAKIIDCDITNFQYLKRLPRIAKRAAYLGLANLEWLRAKYDLIHFQNYYVPYFKGKGKTVTTIHDLGGLKSPDVYPGWYNAYLGKVIRKSVGRSDAVILSTNAIKEELLSLFPDIAESRIHICHYGISSTFFEFRPSEEELVQFNLTPHSYFLYIGNLERRKNIHHLVSQFIAARSEARISKHTKLVLVGKRGIGYEAFKHLLSEQEQVICLDGRQISTEQLVTLYKFCKGFVFPSLYEGFGIPIVEAMSQNIPIIVSDIAPSLERNRAHNNQCFVFELARDGSLIEMLSHIDKYFAQITSGLNYGDLSVYSYDYVARKHATLYSQILNG